MIDVHHIEQISQDCSLTEFVGTTVLDTIGLVIPGIDPSLLEKMNLKKAYKSLGLISSRTGAAGQINAADEAVKSTNTEIVSDVRRAVDIALEYIGKYAGELYISQAGHLEFTFSACADKALHMAFNAPIGKPFGFFCGSPAAIGLVMADLAVKSSPVEVIKYMTPCLHGKLPREPGNTVSTVGYNFTETPYNITHNSKNSLSAVLIRKTVR